MLSELGLDQTKLNFKEKINLVTPVCLSTGFFCPLSLDLCIMQYTA